MSSSLAADPPSAVARAIDRVLEAEREAQSAVTACEHTTSALIGTARQQAHHIVERAAARSASLHARLSQHLERCAADLLEQRLKAAAVAVRALSDVDRRAGAVARLATRLTTETARPDGP